jgi:predicted TPR repeat methyltransferase
MPLFDARRLAASFSRVITTSDGFDRQAADARARSFFDALWTRGDPWELATSEYDRDKQNREFALIADRRYARVLELGCGTGLFSRRLASIADVVVAIDVSSAAIAAATRAGVSDPIEFRAQNIMDIDPVAEGPWDLIVLSETVYYLGWLYPFFDVAWVAGRLFESTRRGGRLLLSNTFGDMKDKLVRPWIIRSYRDLFVNAGYRIEREEEFRGAKGGVELQALITGLRRSAEG